MALRVTAPAKVNLFLGVGPLREDGYHEVRTVLHALEFADTLVIESAPSFRFECAAELGIDAEDNLACRAAAAMQRAFGVSADVSISLDKRIPHGAGLGGGSSDAAAVVAGLSSLWDVEREDPRCLGAARALGADVTFFLTRGGAALMGGRGDVFERELPGLSGVPVALVRPPRPVPTAAAYAAFDRAPREAGDPAAVVRAMGTRDAGALAFALDNNMEAASASVVPQVAQALSWVREAPGVLGAAVAGSGSAVFAICDSDSAAEDLAGAARADRGWWGTATRLRDSGVTIDERGAGR